MGTKESNNNHADIKNEMVRIFKALPDDGARKRMIANLKSQTDDNDPMALKLESLLKNK